MTVLRAGFLVLFLAGAAYANSLGNGFAYDDNFIAVLETLNREYPESHFAFLNRGSGLDRVGDSRAAGEEFSIALRVAPQRYGTLTEVAEFYGRMGQWADAEALLRQAIGIAPSRDDAYRLLSTQLLRQERGREAHGVALAGLANADSHPDLWGAVSESCILEALGEVEAAAAARRRVLLMREDSEGGGAAGAPSTRRGHDVGTDGEAG